MQRYKKYTGTLDSPAYLKILNSNNGWEYCLNCAVHNGECADLAREGRCRAYHFMHKEIDTVEQQMKG